MSVTRLFIENGHGLPMSDVGCVTFSGDGIGGNVACNPFRQVLLTSHSVTAARGLKDAISGRMSF
jgi:hypothetical protein